MVNNNLSLTIPQEWFEQLNIFYNPQYVKLLICQIFSSKWNAWLQLANSTKSLQQTMLITIVLCQTLFHINSWNWGYSPCQVFVMEQFFAIICCWILFQYELGFDFFTSRELTSKDWPQSLILDVINSIKKKKMRCDLI